MSEKVKFGSATFIALFLSWLAYLFINPAFNAKQPQFWFFLTIAGIIFSIIFAIFNLFTDFYWANVISYAASGLTIIFILVSFGIALLNLPLQYSLMLTAAY